MPCRSPKSTWDLIHAIASKVYKRGRKGSYELGPNDF
jgi:hypothetical protein